MKNTRKRTIKGGGCGCSSGGLLGFPQSGGQERSRRRRLLNQGTNMSVERKVSSNSSIASGATGMGEAPQSMAYSSELKQEAPQSMAYLPELKQEAPQMQARGSYSMPMQNSNSGMASRGMSGQSSAMTQQLTNILGSIKQKLNSIDAKVSSMPKPTAPSVGLFGGSQKGGFLGLFEDAPTVPQVNLPQSNMPQPNLPQTNLPQTNLPQPSMMANPVAQPMARNTLPSAQNIVKMPAVTATNSGSANERIRNLEQRLSKMESKGGFSFFGGRRRRKTRKVNRKKRSSRK